MLRLRTTLFLLPGLCLPVTLAAQTPRYTYLDQKAPYANARPPMLTALNLPRLGKTLRLQVPFSWRQRNRSGIDYLIATGLKNPGIPIAALGGFLFTTAEVTVQSPMSPLGAPGRTTMTFRIPNAVQLLGFSFYQQVLEIPAVAPIRLRLSRGGHGVIGR